MEHPTITFLNPHLLRDNKIDGISTVIHEIAHSWSGNTVTT
jgi:aminopeptidase N